MARIGTSRHVSEIAAALKAASGLYSSSSAPPGMSRSVEAEIHLRSCNSPSVARERLLSALHHFRYQRCVTDTAVQQSVAGTFSRREHSVLLNPRTARHEVIYRGTLEKTRGRKIVLDPSTGDQAMIRLEDASGPEFTADVTIVTSSCPVDVRWRVRHSIQLPHGVRFDVSRVWQTQARQRDNTSFRVEQLDAAFDGKVPRGFVSCIVSGRPLSTVNDVIADLARHDGDGDEPQVTAAELELSDVAGMVRRVGPEAAAQFLYLTYSERFAAPSTRSRRL